MKKTFTGWFGLAIVSILLGACASPGEQALMQQKAELESQLTSANNEITQLKKVESSLREKIGSLEHTASVLTTEKTSRVEESSSLRGQVRVFVQKNIDDLKSFMVQGNLLDYVGSELVARSKQDKTPLFLIDFSNPMPNSGILTGVGGYFSQSGDVVVKVLHPVDGDTYVIIWESKPLEVERLGRQQIQFPVSVGVEKGDIIGYYFAKAPNVGFDTSTGETLYQSGDVALGGIVNKSTLSGSSDRRAYSLGVYGLMDNK